MITLTWTAWNNGQHAPSGTGYGIKVPIGDRDKHFRHSWKTITLDVPAKNGYKQVKVNIANKSFWSDTCHELISKEIGAWLVSSGKAPWPLRRPPKLRIALVSEGHFRIVSS